MSRILGQLPNAGRVARVDQWSALGVSTITKISEALASGDRELAVELFDYHAEREARSVLAIYYRWIPDLVDWMGARMEPEILEKLVKASLMPLRGEHQATDVASAAAQDATTPHGESLVDNALGRPVGWRQDEGARLESAARSLIAGAVSTEQALAAVSAFSAAFREAHDFVADWVWALVTQIRHQLGEEAVGTAYLETCGAAIVSSRTSFEELSRLTPAEITQLTAESMRGHFSGPDRTGDLEVVEEHDRFVVTFDPCGSGGRMRRGGTEEPSRVEGPFGYGLSEGAHPWTWGEKNVCLYCAHCSVVNEILPIDAVGYPKRVTQYPAEPGDPCRWLIYKRPEDIPDEYYTRVGRVKPVRFLKKA